MNLSHAVVVAGLLTAAAPASGDAVLDWDALMLDAVRVDNSGPTLSTRNLAMLHTAMYDAVNSVVRTCQPFRFLLDAPSGTSTAAAATVAAHEITTHLYPTLLARADQLLAMHLAGEAPSAGVTNGLVLGAAVARAVLESRAGDGSATQVPYIPSTAPGQWRRTPPFFRPPLDPHWRYVDLFCLPDKEPFVAPGPPALNSPAYARALNEVRQLGAKNSTLRTAEQGQIAVFWSDFSYTAMPPGHWHEIAATIARNRNSGLAENARLFALLSLAQADAAIVCWEAKYRHNFWRPVTAIQRSDEDANPDTTADAAWDHYLNSPPFPEYPSGHSTFSGASARVLTHFLGADEVRFTVTADALPGVTRSFTSLTDCANEVGRSRVLGGIHFEFSNHDGKRSGALIGDYVAGNFLLPDDVLPRLAWGPSPGGGVGLRAHGHLGRTVVVEASSDFSRWTPVATNAAMIGGFPVVGPGGGALDHRFYRAIEEEP